MITGSDSAKLGFTWFGKIIVSIVAMSMVVTLNPSLLGLLAIGVVSALQAICLIREYGILVSGNAFTKKQLVYKYFPLGVALVEILLFALL